MIERIVIENFKSLRKVDLTLGRMNLFIGTNASGKSNFLDTLRFLQGIGSGFTINETFNGKPKEATNEVWEGIRGGSAHACFSGAHGRKQVEITVYGVSEESLPSNWSYHVAFLPLENGKVTEERIETTGRTRSFSWHSKHGLAHVDAKQGMPPLLHARVPVSPDDDEIKTLREFYQELKETKTSDLLGKMQLSKSKSLATQFSDVQHINPAPDVLRTYAQYNQAQRMGDNGQNFAALVQAICQDAQMKDAYLSWLQQLRPEEVSDIGTLPGALGEPMFVLVENGRKVPAPVLSDGTLRFAALAASFFQPSMPEFMTIEEIENGIHANRVQFLLELMRTLAVNRKTQVVATTHSATVLDWLREEDYKTTFLCRRDESTGESNICSLADLPHFMDVVRKKPASQLFAEGWMEMVP